MNSKKKSDKNSLKSIKNIKLTCPEIILNKSWICSNKIEENKSKSADSKYKINNCKETWEDSQKNCKISSSSIHQN